MNELLLTLQAFLEIYILSTIWFSDFRKCHIEGVFFIPIFIGKISRKLHSIGILHYAKKHLHSE